MKTGANRHPRCIMIAGPNSAGTTTFARESLPTDAGIIHFVNADLVASRLSPLRPELAALASRRLFLAELDWLARARADFAFEAKPSGLICLRRLQLGKAAVSAWPPSVGSDLAPAFAQEGVSASLTANSMSEKPSNPARASGAHWFATTHWSLVLAAGDHSTPGSADALEKLCGVYWYPLYAYVRRKGYQHADAEDLTQQFFARLLQNNRVSLAQRERGRFRTFLLTALNHFLINEWTKEHREKRGGTVEFVPIRTGDPETLYAAEPADLRTPETVYEERWAAATMRRAFDRLEAEHRGDGARLFAAFKPFVWGEKAQVPQAEIAAALGLSEGAVRVAIHRLRRRYREILRAEITQTVGTPEEVDDELRHLIQVVSRGSS